MLCPRSQDSLLNIWLWNILTAFFPHPRGVAVLGNRSLGAEAGRDEVNQQTQPVLPAGARPVPLQAGGMAGFSLRGRRCWCLVGFCVLMRSPKKEGRTERP